MDEHGCYNQSSFTTFLQTMVIHFFFWCAGFTFNAIACFSVYFFQVAQIQGQHALHISHASCMKWKVKVWSILSVSANQWMSRTLTGMAGPTVTSCPVPIDLRLVPSSGSSHRRRYHRLIKRTGLYLITHVSASLMSSPTDVLNAPDPTFTSGIIPKEHILATAGCSQAFRRLWWMH